MARSRMTFSSCVTLKLADHLSYCLLHLHIHFDSHTQRCRHASDYFARVGCWPVDRSHYANGLRVNRFDMAAGNKHRFEVFWLDDSDRGLFSLFPFSPLRGGAGDEFAPNGPQSRAITSSAVPLLCPHARASKLMDPNERALQLGWSGKPK